MRTNFLFAGFILILFLAGPARAESYTYKPPECEFSITLPSAPYQADQCDPPQSNNCRKVTSFTKVFGMEATVDVQINCAKAEDDMYDKYDGAIMEATLAALAASHYLKDYETASQAHDDYKQAVLLGTGTGGNNQDKIYTAQMWIGKKSTFTMEATLSGAQMADADDMFAGIIRSIRYDDESDTDAKKEKSDEPESGQTKK